MPVVHIQCFIAPAAQQLPGRQARLGAVTLYSHSMVDYDRPYNLTWKIYEYILYNLNRTYKKHRLNCYYSSYYIKESRFIVEKCRNGKRI